MGGDIDIIIIIIIVARALDSDVIQMFLSMTLNHRQCHLTCCFFHLDVTCGRTCGAFVSTIGFAVFTCKA